MNERSNHSESRSYVRIQARADNETKCPLNTVSPGKILDGPIQLYREMRRARKGEIERVDDPQNPHLTFPVK